MSANAKRGEQIAKSKQTQNLTIFVVIGLIAFVVAAAFIVLSNSNAGSESADVDYSDIPQERLADGGFVLGNPNAPITLVEFADFFCPHCQTYKPTVNQFIEEFVATGQARFEYRMLPTSAGGANSNFAARLAECANEMTDNGFWVAHDVLFDLASSGVRDEIGRELASRLDLSFAELMECQQDATQYETDAALATRVGVSGTPAVRVRYGDSTPQTIQGYERGGAPIEALRGLVISATGQLPGTN